MTPEELKKLNELIGLVPEYEAQLDNLKKGIHAIGEILIAEYNSNPQPCPCCGSLAKVYDSKAIYFPWRVYCSRADCDNTAHCYGNTREQAIMRWNNLVYSVKSKEIGDER